MESRGRGRRGRPRDDSRPSPAFDKYALMEAMSIAFTSIAQASAAGDQGGSNNL